MDGINIYSGAGGLGSALTNPTELAFRKGALQERYPIEYLNRQWPDVESAYQILKVEDTSANDRLMVALIAAKFAQHPNLMQEVQTRGGRTFLEACEHFTGARSDNFKAWEGKGMQSRFIRNLVCAFDRASQGELAAGQCSLF